MKRVWAQSLREGTIAGLAGGALSAAALAACGRGGPFAAINAVSHWMWGDEALRDDEPRLRHTPVGFATHMGAAVFWAVVYARVIGHRNEAKEPVPALAGAIAASTTAFIVDYTVTPKRLRPGYEHRLDGKGMFAVYAALAAGFAMAAIAMSPRRRPGSLAMATARRH